MNEEAKNEGGAAEYSVVRPLLQVVGQALAAQAARCSKRGMQAEASMFAEYAQRVLYPPGQGFSGTNRKEKQSATYENSSIT